MKQLMYEDNTSNKCHLLKLIVYSFSWPESEDYVVVKRVKCTTAL